MNERPPSLGGDHSANLACRGSSGGYTPRPYPLKRLPQLRRLGRHPIHPLTAPRPKHPLEDHRPTRAAQRKNNLESTKT